VKELTRAVTELELRVSLPRNRDRQTDCQKAMFVDTTPVPRGSVNLVDSSATGDLVQSVAAFREYGTPRWNPL
jgi:hypothetical protein